MSGTALYVYFFSPFILEIVEQARRIARVCWKGIVTNFSLTFHLKRGESDLLESTMVCTPNSGLKGMGLTFE